MPRAASDDEVSEVRGVAVARPLAGRRGVMGATSALECEAEDETDEVGDGGDAGSVGDAESDVSRFSAAEKSTGARDTAPETAAANAWAATAGVVGAATTGAT